eukprot:3251898-Heterocapsa_arctica.AAC.1
MFSISSGGGGSTLPEAFAGIGLPMNRRSIKPPRNVVAVVVGSTGAGTGTSCAACRGRRRSPGSGSGRVGALA